MPKKKKQQAVPFTWASVPLPPTSDFAPPFEDEPELSKFVKKPKAYRQLDAVGNIYRGPAVPKPAPCADEEWPTCECPPGEGCGDHCFNRSVFMECKLGACRGGLNRANGDCGNTATQTRAFPPTEVVLTPGCGWGLRVEAPVTKGRPLAEYCGEVITTDMCRERLGNLERGEDFYFASLDAHLVLDAAHMGSNARFANHSCDPNCQLQKWVVGGVPRVVLCADQDLASGTVACYNYMADTMDGLVKRQECKCNATNCCGLIGGRVAQAADKEWSESASRILNQAKPKLDALQGLAAKAKELGLSPHASTSSGGVDLKRLFTLVAEGEAWVQSLADATAAAAAAAVPTSSSSCLSSSSATSLEPDSETSINSSSSSSKSSSSSNTSSSNSGNSNSSGCLTAAVTEKLLASVPSSLRITEASQLRAKQQQADMLRRTIDRMFPPSLPLPLDKAQAEPTSSAAADADASGGAAAVDAALVANATVAHAATSPVSPRAALASSSSSSSISAPSEPPPPPVAVRPSMKQLAAARETAERCWPVEVTNLEKLQWAEDRVEDWAIRACKALQLRPKGYRRPANKTSSEQPAAASSSSSSSANPGAAAAASAARGGVGTGGTALEALTTELEAIVDLGFKFEGAENDDGDHEEGNGGNGEDDEGAISGDDEDSASDSDDDWGKENRKATASTITSGKKVEEAEEEEEESDEDPEGRHCLCRLTESSLQSTMAKCHGCRGWYHLSCVHLTAISLKRRGKAFPFWCPLCLHKSSVPSPLAQRPPPAARRAGKLSRVPLGAVREMVVAARAELPITGLVAVNFLAFLVDSYDAWAQRCANALAAAEAALEKRRHQLASTGEAAVVSGTSRAARGEAEDDGMTSEEARSEEGPSSKGGAAEDLSLRPDATVVAVSTSAASGATADGGGVTTAVFGASPVVDATVASLDSAPTAAAATASVPTTMTNASINTASNASLSRAQLRRQRRFECRLLQRISQLVSEGGALEVETDRLVRQLRGALWRLTVGILPWQEAVASSSPSTPPSLPLLLPREASASVAAQQQSSLSSLESKRALGWRKLLQHWAPGARSLDLESLNQMVEWGQEVAPQSSELVRLQAVQDHVLGWLEAAETLPFASRSLLALAGNPKLPSRFALGNDVGYRRLLAALLHEQQQVGKQQREQKRREARQKEEAVNAEDPDEEEEESTEFCLCRRGDDGASMVGCEECEEWFHAGCLGLATTRSGALKKVAAPNSSSSSSQGSKKDDQPEACDPTASFVCPVCSEVKKRTSDSSTRPSNSSSNSKRSAPDSTKSGTKTPKLPKEPKPLKEPSPPKEPKAPKPPKEPKEPKKRKGYVFVDAEGAEIKPAQTPYALFCAHEKPKALMEAAVEFDAEQALAAGSVAGFATGAGTVGASGSGGDGTNADAVTYGATGGGVDSTSSATAGSASLIGASVGPGDNAAGAPVFSPAVESGASQIANGDARANGATTEATAEDGVGESTSSAATPAIGTAPVAESAPEVTSAPAAAPATMGVPTAAVSAAARKASIAKRATAKVANLWGALQDKSPWNALAAADAERYARAMASNPANAAALEEQREAKRQARDAKLHAANAPTNSAAPNSSSSSSGTMATSSVTSSVVAPLPMGGGIFGSPLNTSSWSAAAKSIASWLLQQPQQHGALAKDATSATATANVSSMAAREAPSADTPASVEPANEAPSAVDATSADLPPSGGNPMSDL